MVRCVYRTDISGNNFQTRAFARSRDDAVGITARRGSVSEPLRSWCRRLHQHFGAGCRLGWLA